MKDVGGMDDFNLRKVRQFHHLRKELVGGLATGFEKTGYRLT